MATWAEFAAAAPIAAEGGRQLFYRTSTGEALLATVRGEALPQIHPIYVGIVDGRLLAFIGRSSKAVDLAEDGRYALHAHQDPAAPHEFLLRGHARPIDDPESRSAYAGAWYFDPGDDYRLFEFLIDHAVFGERPTADDWPPRYTKWSSIPG
jgi:hypothetical protein